MNSRSASYHHEETKPCLLLTAVFVDSLFGRAMYEIYLICLLVSHVTHRRLKTGKNKRLSDAHCLVLTPLSSQERSWG